jgi:sulfur carrier protein
MKLNNSSRRKRDLAILEKRVNIIVNGSAMELQDGVTVENLLAHLELDPHLVAVELNLEIISKTDYRTKEISEGDRIEIVHFVGGG